MMSQHLEPMSEALRQMIDLAKQVMNLGEQELSQIKAAEDVLAGFTNEQRQAHGQATEDPGACFHLIRNNRCTECGHDFARGSQAVKSNRAADTFVSVERQTSPNAQVQVELSKKKADAFGVSITPDFMMPFSRPCTPWPVDHAISYVCAPQATDVDHTTPPASQESQNGE